MTYVGIDPGLGGAVAWIERETEFRPRGRIISVPSVVPTPTMCKGKKGRQYDMKSCWDLLDGMTRPICVVLEHAQAMPKQGASSGFNYGIGYGMWQAFLTNLDCQWQIVTPRRWQKVILEGVPHGPGETKSASILVAKRLFGGVSLKRTDKCGKDDDGMSDALHIAEFGRRTHERKAE